MTPRRFILVILFAIAVGACSSSSSAETDISETPMSVAITSGTGNVAVSAADSGATISAEISASGEDPPWSAEIVGTELVIDDGCGDRTDCEVDFTIAVAGTADVAISSADGGITVVDMNSRVSITGAASNVLLNGITGPISVDLVRGDLLGARLVSTDASFRTGEGNLDVTLTAAFTSLTVISGSGDVTAQVPGGGYDVDATSASGGIDVNIDVVAGAASSIVMRTESGDVTIYRR